MAFEVLPIRALSLAKLPASDSSEPDNSTWFGA